MEIIKSEYVSYIRDRIRLLNKILLYIYNYRNVIDIDRYSLYGYHR